MMIHQAKAVWYTPQLLGVLSLVVLLALSTPVRAQVTVEAERYNTAQLISRTLTALPDCLSYCLLGIELRMRVTLTGVRLYFVPRVKHHMAALHVITANETTQEPYIEWALIMGRVQKLMLDQLAVLLGAEESGGRLTRYGQYGRHQATRFKENALMGHPVFCRVCWIPVVGYPVAYLARSARSIRPAPVSTTPLSPGLPTAGVPGRFNVLIDRCRVP